MMGIAAMAQVDDTMRETNPGFMAELEDSHTRGYQAHMDKALRLGLMDDNKYADLNGKEEAGRREEMVMFYVPQVYLYEMADDILDAGVDKNLVEKDEAEALKTAAYGEKVSFALRLFDALQLQSGVQNPELTSALTASLRERIAGTDVAIDADKVVHQIADEQVDAAHEKGYQAHIAKALEFGILNAQSKATLAAMTDAERKEHVLKFVTPQVYLYKAADDFLRAGKAMDLIRAEDAEELRTAAYKKKVMAALRVFDAVQLKRGNRPEETSALQSTIKIQLGDVAEIIESAPSERGMGGTIRTTDGEEHQFSVAGF